MSNVVVQVAQFSDLDKAKAVLVSLSMEKRGFDLQNSGEPWFQIIASSYAEEYWRIRGITSLNQPFEGMLRTTGIAGGAAPGTV